MEFITISEHDGIAILTLNRPDKRNAMHGPLLQELLQALKVQAQHASRVLLINGKGENFCAGGDIGWMQKIAAATQDENQNDAQLLADVLYQLYVFPKPTIVLAHGATLGGGLGLVAAADIALAAKDASFGLPEVKIGITPSVISPYVINAIGERFAHYYFLTGERFDADVALRLGLVQKLTEVASLQETGINLAKTLLQNSPLALQAAKQLIRNVARQKMTVNLAQQTAQHLAELRATPEAQEGLRAFLEKRKPGWV